MRRDRRPLLRPARRHRPVPPRAREGRLRRWPWSRPCAARRARHHRPRPRRPAQPRAPRRHRLRRGTGDGAGILTQMPDAFLRAVAGLRAAAGRRYAVGMAFLPATPTSAPPPRPASRTSPPSEGLRVLGWRDVPVAPELVGGARPRVHAGLRAALRRLRSAASLDAASSSTASPSACASAPSTRSASTSRRCRPAPSSTRAWSRRAARAVLPRPAGRALRLRARARALALLDQHLPVVAARAAVPHDRAQRRDQHRQGQPQLDAGPRSRSSVRPAPGDLDPGLPDLHAGRLRLGLLRRGARAAAPRRPVAAARDA